MRLLLIDNRVSQKTTFLNSAKAFVETIEYDYENDTYDSLLQKINEGDYEWESVAFVFHEPSTFYFQLLLKESPMIVNNVKNVDPTLQLWDKFKEFLSQINTPIFDFLACKLYADPNWRYVFEGLEGTSKGGFNIRASIDDTGNLSSGGDWMLESETPEVDAKILYFTDDIQNYTDVLTPVPTAYFSDTVNYTLKFSGFISNNCMIRDAEGNLYVGGAFTTTQSILCNRVAKYNISLNKWEILGDGFNSQCNALAINPLNGDLYAGGSFTQSISLDGTITILNFISKFDKVIQKWTPIRSNVSPGSIGTNATVNALVFDTVGNLYIGGNFTAAFGFTANRIVGYTPSNNSVFNLGVNNFITGGSGVNTIAISPTTGVVYVGGSLSATTISFTSIAAWNPATNTWSALGTGGINGLNGIVNVITVASDGTVYIGGFFTATSGGLPNITLNRIANYNPTTGIWSPLGGTGTSAGLNTTVASVNCITINPVNGDLYMGGSFTATNVSLTPVGRIAKYTPGDNTFSPIGTGVSTVSGTGGSVNALLLNENSDTLYIGGSFVFSDGLDTVNISQLNLGTNVYSSLNSINGNILPDTCNFIKRSSSGDLYACSSVNVYRWDSINSLWVRLGKGFTGGIVNTMTITADGTIYVGGSMTQSGGITVNSIAKYNSINDSFEAIGGLNVGVNSSASVNVITADGNDLYIGGSFTTAGAVLVNRVTRYISATDTFYPLNSGGNPGVTNTVRAIAIASTGDVYIGGSFNAAGVISMLFITRYTPTGLGTGTFAALSSSNGVNGEVNAITINTFSGVETVYIGGAFTIAGGVIGFGGIASYTLISNAFTKIPNDVVGGFGGDSPLVRTIAVDSNNNIYAGGGMTSRALDVASVSRIAKFNGTNWIPLREGLSSSCNSIELESSGSDTIVYAAGAFLLADNNSSNFISKFYDTSDPLDSKWEAIGDPSNITNPSLTVFSTAVKSDGTFYVATSSSILTWNSSVNRWINIIPSLTGSFNFILISKDQQFLYAAGNFIQIGLITLNRIAKYEFATQIWSPLSADVTFPAGGFDNTCNILIHSKIENDETIYIGGNFTSAKGITYNRVASYDPDSDSFSALGNGLNNSCNILAIDSVGNVYAGGIFSEADTTPVNNIAKWDGFSWSALGAGLNDTCNALIVDSEDNLYAGGNFNLSGTIELNSVGKWDGTSWSGLIYNGVNGIRGICETLTVDQDDNLYVGGNLNQAGGVNVNAIAIWGDDVWSQFNSTGASFPILTLNYVTLGGVNKLYVGGGFANFRGLTTNFSQTFNIVDITQRVDPTQSWEPITKTFGDAPFFTSPITNSTGLITYTSSDESVAIIDAVTGLVTLTGVGTALLTASQAGDENYNPQIITTILTVEPIPVPPAPKGEPSQLGIGLLIGGIILSLVIFIITVNRGLTLNSGVIICGITFFCLLVGFILLYNSM